VWKTTLLFHLVKTNQITKTYLLEEITLTFFLSLMSLLMQYEF